MMLAFLSKKDSLWRSKALKICKCKDLADELTNLMYLRIYNYNTPIEKLTENYVGWVIYNLFRDHCKKKHDTRLDYRFTPDTRNLMIDGVEFDKYISEASILAHEEDTSYDFDDKDLEIINKANELKWWQKQLLVESYDKSFRQIEKEFNINYVFVQRHTTKAKKHILGEDYKPYQNKRLKNKNNGKRSA